MEFRATESLSVATLKRDRKLIKILFLRLTQVNWRIKSI